MNRSRAGLVFVLSISGIASACSASEGSSPLDAGLDAADAMSATDAADARFGECKSACEVHIRPHLIVGLFPDDARAADVHLTMRGTGGHQAGGARHRRMPSRISSSVVLLLVRHDPFGREGAADPGGWRGAARDVRGHGRRFQPLQPRYHVRPAPPRRRGQRLDPGGNALRVPLRYALTEGTRAGGRCASRGSSRHGCRRGSTRRRRWPRGRRRASGLENGDRGRASSPGSVGLRDGGRPQGTPCVSPVMPGAPPTPPAPAAPATHLFGFIPVTGATPL